MVSRLIPTAFLALVLILAAGLGNGEQRAYLEVSPQGRDDLVALMSTLEGHLDQGLPMTDPVVVVLHGSEATAFTSAGY
ncbi:MAG: hypothetical protein EP301_10265, partial [Gammaproteobacteria bacterium]